MVSQEAKQNQAKQKTSLNKLTKRLLYFWPFISCSNLLFKLLYHRKVFSLEEEALKSTNFVLEEFKASFYYKLRIGLSSSIVLG